VVIAAVLVLSGWHTDRVDTALRHLRPAGARTCLTPPRNPFMATSPAPIGHIDAAQTNSSPIRGPRDTKQTLGPGQLRYSHLGPGHFGLAISSKYPDGSRVIWSNGGDRISKLDERTLKVISELPLPGKQPQTAGEADADLATLDHQSGAQLAQTGLQLAAKYLQGITGVYYVLDRDNTLFVGGPDSVIAYHDRVAGDPRSPIEVRDEWARPPEVQGGFVGVNMTFDGKLVLITDEGWIVLLDRDFSSYVAAPMVGADQAAAFNQSILARGLRLGAGSWVRNSIAVDDHGGIYAASVDHLQKIVWDGTKLSTDPADGAWSEPYLDGTGLGTGATPALMGYCKDRFVTITDGDELMNVDLFWRDAIPSTWTQLPGAPSRRIAGQLPATMGDPSRTAIQTEQGVVVGGYGALVVNNEPATVPSGFPSAGQRVLVAYSGNDPDFTPHGLQKFEWDPGARRFRDAWVNKVVSSANAVPLVSLGSNTVYTVGVRGRRWALEGLDWSTGRSTLTWITGSSRYNTNFAGIFIDTRGRILHGTTFGIVRYPPADKVSS
jgi:hypothetical protein